MKKYHLNEKGEARPCGATQGRCPYGSSAQHYPTAEEARSAYEKQQGSSFVPLTYSHGQWVRKGAVGVSGFLRQVVAKKGNQRYGGTLEELAQLTQAHLSKGEPGTGSEDGDVLLVPVPPEGFFTDIVAITPENAHRVEEVTEARVEGEAPVTKRVVRGAKPAPAAVVKIVVYRADALAKDDDRSTQDEWEIVAMLTQPREDVPMHPTTMERNASHAKGGTYREYSEEQWAEARKFWSEHAYAEGAPTP